jgi:two-component system chemotaxis response regulator CheY
MIDLDDELAKEYLAECREHLATVETDLLAMEKGGEELDDERVNRAFRAVHSVKGGAGFFDLIKVRELAHRTEDVLALVRSRKMVLTPARAHVLFRAVDQLDRMLHKPDTSNRTDISAIVAELSVLSADRPTAASIAVAPPIETATQGRMRPRILLAEDDFASRLLLQSFLSRYGECHVAVNGREAVEAFRAAMESGRRYDLICMDIMMPEMDGREAVRHVRALEEAEGTLSTYGVKILMTTAVDDIKEVIACFKELCDGYLMKPIDLGDLLNQMKSFNLVR